MNKYISVVLVITSCIMANDISVYLGFVLTNNIILIENDDNNYSSKVNRECLQNGDYCFAINGNNNHSKIQIINSKYTINGYEYYSPLPNIFYENDKLKMYGLKNAMLGKSIFDKLNIGQYYFIIKNTNDIDIFKKNKDVYTLKNMKIYSYITYITNTEHITFFYNINYKTNRYQIFNFSSPMYVNRTIKERIKGFEFYFPKIAHVYYNKKSGIINLIVLMNDHEGITYELFHVDENNIYTDAKWQYPKI